MPERLRPRPAAMLSVLEFLELYGPGICYGDHRVFPGNARRARIIAHLLWEVPRPRRRRRAI